MSDLYSQEDFDYEIVKGNTAQLKFEFYDENGDTINVTGYECKWTLYDKYNRSIVEMLSGVTTHSKEHDDNESPGKGVYFYGDTYLTTNNLDIDANNQVIVLLSAANTSALEARVYRYELQFAYNSDSAVDSPIFGRLIVKESYTG